LVADGATGTNLHSRGLNSGTPAEQWVLDHPKEIIQLHRDFIQAGSQLLLTCTFGASAIKLESFNLEKKTKQINLTAVQLAKEAVEDKEILIAGSVGPSGKLLEPYGPLGETALRDAFLEQISYLIEGGVDLLVIETQYDLREAEIIIQAAKSVKHDIPLVCSFSYDRGTKTMMGITPEMVVERLSSIVDIIGINCGRSLEDNLEVLKKMNVLSSKPIWYKPNAGLPMRDSAGNTVFHVQPKEMGNQVPHWVENGAKIVGGCCGTSPSHVHEIYIQVQQINQIKN